MDTNIKMVVTALSLALLFILKLQFPADQPLVNLISKSYGLDTIKHLRKFGKVIFNICKDEADLDFPRIY